MNAFLIFCKRHRTVVKNRYPHLENRAVTKILGEWWAALETEEKASYTELAKQYKNAFFSANPNFKWYKLPAPPLRTLNTRPGNIVKASPQKQDVEIEEQPQQLFTPGKLADETQLDPLNDAKQNLAPATTASATNIDLFGLATLAEVAAKKAKIDQQQQQ
ncbi:bobby sox [Carabus blaptoides fortunei]